MENFVFYSPTEFVFGRQTEAQVGALCTKYGAHKVMVVYGGGSAVRSGLLSRVVGALESQGLQHVELGGVRPNPMDDLVYDGINLARSAGVDFLLAVGGGSVIDTAKSVAAGVPYDGDFWDLYCGKAQVKAALPVGVVLTIPAAGSEASGNAVITKADGLLKLGLRAPELLRPKFAVMNPELTLSLPAYQTAAGIVDMMAHTMERYFGNAQGTMLTDRILEATLLGIMDSARRLLADPNDYDARANIMWGGTMAHSGIGGVGRQEDWSSHALEHELSALYGVTHGAGLAVVFPNWMRYAKQVHPDGQKIRQFEERVTSIDDLVAFWKQLGMPSNLSELGISNPDFDTLVSKLHKNKGQQFGGYIKLSPSDSRKIYEMCLK